MSAPIGLTIKTTLQDMKTGDCIPCRYTTLTSGQAGYFSELGTCIANEIPVAGTAIPDGLFYFIKTNKGTFIADRVIQTGISWNVLNTNLFIEGKNTLFEYYKPKTYSGTMYSGYVYSNLEDNSTSTVWYSSGTGGNENVDCVILDFETPKDVTAVYMVGTAYGCNTFNIMYSDDNATWTLAYSDALGSNVTKTFSFNSVGEHRYWKVFIKTTFSAGSSGLAELRMGDKSKAGLVRSLTGGVAYADSNGNSSTSDKGLGAWPTSNEWDRYIVNSDLGGKITKGDDNIWHLENIQSHCKETITSGTWINIHGGTSSANSSCRMLRGMNNSSTWNNLNYNISSATSNTEGFRPVLNYIESDIASEVIY
jgi:hypothetical protein